MKSVTAPFMSRYYTGRGVYKLMLNEAFVHVIRDSGLNVLPGYGANVVIQPGAKLKVEFSPAINPKYRFAVRGVGNKLAMSSKEFGPHLLSEMFDRYKLCEIVQKDNCFVVAPLTEYGELEPVPRRADIDQLRGELVLADQQISYLKEQCHLLTRAVKGLIPNQPLNRCVKCMEFPDTEAHFGSVTCGCYNIETYNEWYTRQNNLIAAAYESRR